MVSDCLVMMFVETKQRTMSVFQMAHIATTLLINLIIKIEVFVVYTMNINHFTVLPLQTVVALD